MADSTTTGTDVVSLIEAAAKAAVNEAAAARIAAEDAAKAQVAAVRAKRQADEALAAAEMEFQKAGQAADKAVARNAAKDKATAAEAEAKKAADAKALADKVASAKAALVPSSGRIWPSLLGVGCFGLALGVLTSLTTATGITATLLGLLFTFVGASLLSWFKHESISPEDRSVIAAYTGAVGVGLVVGLFIGFFCRFVEEMWVRPMLVERADRHAKQLQEELNDLRSQIEKLNPEEKPKLDKWRDIADGLKRIEAVYAKWVSTSEKASEKPKSSSVVDLPRYIFSIQVGATDKTVAAANAVDKALDWDKDPTNPEKGKLKEEEREALRSFEQALRKSDPRAHLSPQVRDTVGEMLYRKPKSPIHEEYAKTLRNYLTPADS